MGKDQRRAIKAAEKLRKICEKEVERLGALRAKYDDLRHAGDAAPLVGQFVDRLQQKELMASGDLVWAQQMLEQLRADPAPTAAPVAADPARPAVRLI